MVQIERKWGVPLYYYDEDYVLVEELNGLKKPVVRPMPGPEDDPDEDRPF